MSYVIYCTALYVLTYSYVQDIALTRGTAAIVDYSVLYDGVVRATLWEEVRLVRIHTSRYRQNVTLIHNVWLRRTRRFTMHITLGSQTEYMLKTSNVLSIAV